MQISLCLLASLFDQTESRKKKLPASHQGVTSQAAQAKCGLSSRDNAGASGKNRDSSTKSELLSGIRRDLVNLVESLLRQCTIIGDNRTPQVAFIRKMIMD